MAALHLTVVTRRVRPDQLSGSFLEQSGGQIALAVRETVGELEAVVRLDTFHLCISAGVGSPQRSRRTTPDRLPENAAS